MGFLWTLVWNGKITRSEGKVNLISRHSVRISHSQQAIADEILINVNLRKQRPLRDFPLRVTNALVLSHDRDISHHSFFLVNIGEIALSAVRLVCVYALYFENLHYGDSSDKVNSVVLRGNQRGNQRYVS